MIGALLEKDLMDELTLIENNDLLLEEDVFMEHIILEQEMLLSQGFISEVDFHNRADRLYVKELELEEDMLYFEMFDFKPMKYTF